LHDFVRLRDFLEAWAREHAIPFFFLLEEVGSMSVEHRRSFNDMLRCTPVAAFAGDWGWVHRSRIFWGLPPEHEHVCPAYEWLPSRATGSDCAVVRWKGAPEPHQWSPHHGAQWQFRHEATRQAPAVPGLPLRPVYGLGRFATFTTAFPHKPDRPPHRDADEALLFFTQDGGRFPLAHYHRSNLLFSGSGKARPLSADEREQLHGLPPAYTDRLQGNARLSAIGNGWHLPSIVLLLFILLQPVTAGHVPAPQFCNPVDFVPAAASHVSVPPNPSDFLSGVGLLDGILALFPRSFFPEEFVEHAEDRLAHLDVNQLRSFHAYARSHGVPGLIHVPDKQAILNTVARRQALCVQERTPGFAIKVPDRLLPLDLSTDQHIAAALQLQHPFNEPDVLEADVAYATSVMVSLGPEIVRWRDARLSLLRSVVRALRKMDTWARAQRPTQALPGMSPVFTAVAVVVLDWVDVTLPYKLVTGFELMGNIGKAGVYRDLEQPIVGAPLSEFYGKQAITFVDSLEADLRVHPCANEILECTLAEQQLCLCSAFLSRAQCDAMFGPGQWRPLPRHVVHQNGKFRPIDDGKRGGHNGSATMSESIVCSSADFVPRTIRHLARQALQQVGAVRCRDLPTWFFPLIGVEDMWKGYRQNHCRAEDRGACIATFVHPQERKRCYVVLHGLPFGLASSVLQFNRMPALFSAFCRRVLAFSMAHYFDDNTHIEWASVASVAKNQFIRTAVLFSILFSHDKRQRLSCVPQFLGRATDVAPLRSDGAIIFGPRPGQREKAASLIDEVIERGTLSPGQAAKLRGSLQWLDLVLAGRPCRPALAALIERQYASTPGPAELDDVLVDGLLYLKAAVLHIPDRVVHVDRPDGPPVVIYTDASYEAGRAILGGLVFVDGLVFCFSTPVPSEVLHFWQPRLTHINQAELLAAPVLLTLLHEALLGRDLLWFIDNSSACAALIRNTSSSRDSRRLAMLTSACFGGLGCRTWVEHVGTSQNPADPLSRAGLADPVVRQHITDGSWREAPNRSIQWERLMSSSFDSIWSWSAALG
jgi:hypothetical protein